MSSSRPPLEPLVRSRRDLLVDGWTDRSLADAVAAGRLVLLRRGRYFVGDGWGALWPEEKHRAHVIAVDRDVRGSTVMSHSSAAVLWGLPLYLINPVRVHMTMTTAARISSSPDVQRHIGPLDERDVVVVDGIRCTGLSRTVFDLIRSLPLSAAVAVADAGERRFVGLDGVNDSDLVESWRATLGERIDCAAGGRGIRQARWVAAFGDGRADGPGESVSRLQLHRLGFEAPELQVPIVGPRGSRYFVDFGFRRIRAFGEFDGTSKYVDEALRAGKPLEEVLLAEKQREDWIRGTTQWRLARWGSAHISTPDALARRLASFNILPS